MPAGANVFYEHCTSPIAHTQNFCSYTGQYCIILFVVLSLRNFLSIPSYALRLTEYRQHSHVLYRFVLSMARATSNPIIPTDPHALSNLTR